MQVVSWLQVKAHQTAHRTGAPMMAYLPQQLREILAEAMRRAGASPYGATYRQKPIKQIRGAVLGAVLRAAEHSFSARTVAD